MSQQQALEQAEKDEAALGMLKAEEEAKAELEEKVKAEAAEKVAEEVAVRAELERLDQEAADEEMEALLTAKTVAEKAADRASRLKELLQKATQEEKEGARRVRSRSAH
jgi:glycosyltransferase A (GT-A) superfamily protein (DUF2064 family)